MYNSGCRGQCSCGLWAWWARRTKRLDGQAWLASDNSVMVGVCTFEYGDMTRSANEPTVLKGEGERDESLREVGGRGGGEGEEAVDEWQ